MRNTKLTIATAFVLSSFSAHAELIDIVNDIRSTGCGQQRPAATRVENDAALDAAASLVARGSKIDAALIKSGYRAASATSINIDGIAGDAAISEVLAGGFCEKVNKPTYTAIGTYVRAKEFWAVLAEPFEALAESDASAVAARVLELVNEARKQDRRCGRHR